MSARTYKLQLEKALDLLSNQTTSAREWKQVAENRLALLARVDSLLDVQVTKLLKLGTIFGVDPTDPGLPKADVLVHSGDEVTRMVMAKVGAVSAFTSNLTKEAAELQGTLNSVLSIATESLAVARPTLDIALESHDEERHLSTSPLDEVYDEVENLEERDVEEATFGTFGTEAPESLQVVTRPARLTALFN